MLKKSNTLIGNTEFKSDDLPAEKYITLPVEYDEKFKLVFENAPLGIALISPSWKIIDANNKFSEILNYSDSDIIGTDIRQITYSADLGTTFQFINKVQTGEIDSYKLRKRYVKSTGELVTVQVHYNAIRNESAELQYSVLMVQDLSAEESRDEELKLLEQSINSISEMVSITDEQDIFIFVNKAFKERYGYSENEILGKKPEILRDSSKNNPVILKNSEEKRWTGELINKTKDGEIFSIILETSNVENNDGEVIGYIGIAKDISEQKKLEENMRQAENFAILGRMTSYLSHEIKTPLTAIKLNIEMLTEKLNGEQAYSQSFQIINKEIKRLEKLLKDVLQFSRERENILYEISLKELLKQVTDLLKPVISKKKISIINNFGPEVIKGDSSEIKTMLHQLIENSIEAIDYNGIIEFRSVKDLNKKLLRIFVRDTGSGIKSSIKIFEPFYTTKQSGTGLGLSIVQKIIKKHHGTISLIFSEPGNTIFQISLPLP